MAKSSEIAASGGRRAVSAAAALAVLAACGGGDGMPHDGGALPRDSGSDGGPAVDPCGGSGIPACFAWATPLAVTSEPPRAQLDLNDIVVAGETVVLVGGFLGDADFGTGVRTSDPGPVFTGTSQGDIFVAGYDRATGRPLWTYTAGQGGFDEAFGAAVDADGNVWITGTYEGVLDAAGVHLDDVRGGDILIMRLDARTGTPTAAWSHGARSADAGFAIAVSAAGNIYVTGIFDDFASLGGATLDSAGDPLFVASYDSSGSHRWSLSLHAPPSGGGVFSLPFLGFGPTAELYVAGRFTGMVDLAGQIVTATGRVADVFALRLDEATGAPVWRRTLGDSADDYAVDLALVDGDAVLARRAIGGSELVGGLGQADGADTWQLEADVQELAVRPSGELVARSGAALVGLDPARGVSTWRRELGRPAEYERVERLGVDDEGNLYVAGWSGGYDLGGGPVTGFYLARFSPTPEAP